MEVKLFEFFQRRNLGGNRFDSEVTYQREAPQLCESAEGLRKAPQPKFNAFEPPRAIEMWIQHQLLEAPCELPEGIDVGL